MADPEVLKDQSKIQSIAKEHKELSEILNLYNEYKKVNRQIEEVKQLLNSTPDDDLRELAEEELESLKNNGKT
jgi:Protein chain release factor A